MFLELLQVLGISIWISFRSLFFFFTQPSSKIGNNPNFYEPMSVFWCIHMIEYYSLFKKDQTPDIYMYESQKHVEKMKSNIKHKFYLIPSLQNSRKSTVTVIEIRLVVAWGTGWKRILIIKGPQGNFLHDGNALYFLWWLQECIYLLTSIKQDP